MNEVNTDLLQLLIIFSKKYSGGTAKSEIMPNQQLAEELPKPIIRNLRIFFRIIEKRKINSPFKDNTLGADFTDMQLISKHNNAFDFCCVSLILLVNMHGLFLSKIKRLFQLLILLNKIYLSLIVNRM